jgi:hypothetical protein
MVNRYWLMGEAVIGYSLMVIWGNRYSLTVNGEQGKNDIGEWLMVNGRNCYWLFVNGYLGKPLFVNSEWRRGGS